jgi:type VI secretion system protein ImpK
MSPNFAQAVDPVFLYVLALLDRISRDVKPKPQEERVRIRALIDGAEAHLGASNEWQLAKYALVSWIDEVLVDVYWDGREWWSNNVLEMELFNTRECNEQFYIKAQQASTTPGRDALEVFYVCVILGFRGLYHNMESDSVIAPSLNLPFSLSEWAKQTALALRLRQGREPLNVPTMEIHGAPPLRSRTSVVWPWLAFALSVTGAVILYLVNS